jgi:hypothetical protein
MQIKSAGFKDMAEEQVEELLNFCCFALDIAANYGDDEIAEETESRIHSLIELFGGHAIIDRLLLESPDSEQGSDLHDPLPQEQLPQDPKSTSE